MLSGSNAGDLARQDFIVDGMRPPGDVVRVNHTNQIIRLYNLSFVRKALIILFLAILWQAYAIWLDNDLVFPRLSVTLVAFVEGIRSGELVLRTWASLNVLLIGYAVGLVLAFMMAAAAITFRLGNDILETITSMLNPLPAIALLPLAMLWFGLGYQSLIFVLVHAVLWPMALNAHSGFKSVSKTLYMVGRNYELGHTAFILKILLPAAFPSILAGLKIGWAFAWRTLIAAELVFGVSTGAGGVGWYLFENKNLINIPNVFAGLLTVIFIGLIVEVLIFRQIENVTVRRWGLQFET